MIKAVKGTRDILPPNSSTWNIVEAVAREVFRTYNYSEIRTPIFEETSLFARGVGEDTDIVGKEMYTWEDYDSKELGILRKGMLLEGLFDTSLEDFRKVVQWFLDRIEAAQRRHRLN